MMHFFAFFISMKNMNFEYYIYMYLYIYTGNYVNFIFIILNFS